MKHKDRKPVRALKAAPQVVYQCADCDARPVSKYEAKQHAKRCGHWVKEYRA